MQNSVNCFLEGIYLTCLVIDQFTVVILSCLERVILMKVYFHENEIFQIDTDFIAKYQMNYGVQGDETQSSGDTADSKTTVDPESYYRHYYEAGQTVTMGSKKKKEETKEDTHEEMVEKLEQLESSIQQGTVEQIGWVFGNTLGILFHISP